MSEWFEQLPEQLKEAPFFKPSEDGTVRELDQVVADINGAAQHLGNSIRIPGPDATDETLAEFRLKAAEKIPGLMVTPNPDDEEAMASVLQTLGRPSEADGYTLPEGTEIDGTALGNLKTRAHAYGLTNKQFQSMVADILTDQSSATEARQEALEADLDTLRQEWGESLPTRLNRVAGLLEKSGAPEYLMEALKAKTLPSADLKWLYAMSEALGAEGKQMSMQESEGDNIDPGEALAQLSEIEANPALWDPAHPDHERLKKKRVDMMKKAYPEATTEF
jgi:hypothetical protein